jgi:hypothetical protein
MMKLRERVLSNMRIHFTFEAGLNSFCGLLAIGLLFSSNPGFAEPTDPPDPSTISPDPIALPPMETDRPDITETPFAVPVGVIQAENGFTWFDDPQNTRTLNFPETLLRIGLVPTTELRVTVPNYIGSQRRGLSTNGFEDLLLGIKQEFPFKPAGFDLAAIVNVGVPTGSGGYSGGIGPDIELAWEHQLKGPWEIGGIFAMTDFKEGGQRNLTWSPSVALARSFTEATSAFVEYAGSFPRFGGDFQVLHLGLLHQVTPDHQLDLHGGWGLTASSPNFFVAFGYTFRTPRLWGKGSRKLR